MTHVRQRRRRPPPQHGRELRDREDGQTLVEYALIIAIIALGLILALYFLRGEIRELFSDTGNTLDTQAP